MLPKNLTVVNHPLVQELITKIGDRTIDAFLFREYCNRVSRMLIYEVLHDVKEEKIAFVAILRAGMAMLGAAMETYPQGEFHLIGMRRDLENPYEKKPQFYLDKLHEINSDTKRIIILEPMLATGGSLIATLEAIAQHRELNTARIQIVALNTAKFGAEALLKTFPKVQIFTAAFFPELNKKAYIVGGLGDAGERFFGIQSDPEHIQ
ncbi:MAG: uracil phosphoribosyltransferase [bacterium]